MNISLQGIDLDIVDLTQDTIQPLAEKLSDWQQHPQFMRFLKDMPASPTENTRQLENAFADKHNIHKLIIEHTQQKIIGLILFDHFNPQDGSLESYTRVDPTCKSKGIGTQCRRKIIEELLSCGTVTKIVSWHSAWNHTSFVINKRAGFKLVDFTPDETFLPNINKVTDDFKREIDKEQVQKPKLIGSLVDMDQSNRETIMQGIQKHDLFHLLWNG